MRMSQDDEDVLSDLEPLLRAADLSQSPWDPKSGEYMPDYDLAQQLLGVPISQGHADDQESGRTAKALDAWIAHELRRAGFPPDAVWPRVTRPRVLPADLVPADHAIDEALARLAEFEQRLQAYGEAAVTKGLKRSLPSLYRVGPAIRSIREALPGSTNGSILGSHYAKQVDVIMSTWQRGAEILISSKTQFSSYQKNKNNRYEEALGEIKNLKDRHPMAAAGYAFLVRTNVFTERGSFAFLRDLLIRTRKPDGPFDATMLLAAEWDEETNELTDLQNPTPHLSAPKFFADIVDAVASSTPFDLHQEVRTLRDGEPPGGLPDVDEHVAPDEALERDQFE
jgi:hypothetical protein